LKKTSNTIKSMSLLKTKYLIALFAVLVCLSAVASKKTLLRAGSTQIYTSSNYFQRSPSEVITEFLKKFSKGNDSEITFILSSCPTSDVYDSFLNTRDEAIDFCNCFNTIDFSYNPKFSQAYLKDVKANILAFY
jgi:hypothetical protein